MNKAVAMWMVCVVILMFAACRSRTAGVAGTVVLNHSDTVMSERSTIVKLDTVVVGLEVPRQSVKEVVNDTVSVLENDFAFSKAWIENDGRLGHLLQTKPQSIPVKVTVPRVTETESVVKQTVKEVPVEVPRFVEKSLTSWQRFQITMFWMMTLTVIGYTIGKIRSWRLL